MIFGKIARPDRFNRKKTGEGKIYAYCVFCRRILFVFLFLIDLIFSNTLSVLTDILAVVCWVVAFLVSVGLAEYTVKRIKEKYKEK